MFDIHQMALNYPQFFGLFSSFWCSDRVISTTLYFFVFFLNINIYFNWRLITLQYGSGSAVHWHESATGAHVLPVLRPRSLPLGQPSAPALLCVSAYWSVLWIIQFVDSSAIFFMSVIVSSIIISSLLYLLPLCGVLTLFFHASPDRSQYLLFVYLMGPLGLAVSLAFSSCIEWGLHSVLVRGLPIVLSSLVEHRL